MFIIELSVSRVTVKFMLSNILYVLINYSWKILVELNPLLHDISYSRRLNMKSTSRLMMQEVFLALL